MIQRIQSIYILISAILLGLLFVLPFAEIVQSGQIYQFNIKGIEGANQLLQNGWAITLLVGIMLLIHTIVLFSFKKRILQMRMLTFAILLSLGLIGLLIFFVQKSFQDPIISYKIALSFPIIIVIIDYLAIREIGKDEALIRSLDRIR